MQWKTLCRFTIFNRKAVFLFQKLKGKVLILRENFLT